MSLANRPIFSLLLFLSLCFISTAQEFSLDDFQEIWTNAADADKISLLEKHLPAISGPQRDQFLTEAIFIAKDRGLKKEEGKLYMLLGITWYGIGDYPKALENYQVALSLQEEIGDQAGMGRTYNELATFVKKQKDYVKATTYLDLSQQLCTEAKDLSCLGTSYNNRGLVFAEQKIWDKAELSYKKSLKTYLEIPDTLGVGYVYANLAEVASNRKEYSEAIRLLELSTQYKKWSNDNFGVAINTTNTGELYFKQKKYRKAAAYFQKSTASTQVVDLQAWNHRFSSRCYAELGETQKALDFLTRSYALKDSLLSAKRVADLAEMETKYETEQKEQKIALQELELKNQAEKFRLQMMSFGGISIALILAGLFGFLYYRQQQTTLLQEKEMTFQKELLHNTLSVQEQERKRIAKDLHDGIGQQLTGLRMAWQNIFERVGPKIPEEANGLNQLKGILEDTTAEVRSISHQMMPRALRELGLLSALEDLVSKTFPNDSIQCEFDHHGIKERLPENIEIQVYRIIQELLNNILKHSGATEVGVQVYKTKQQLVVVVEDNGIGFNPDDQDAKGHGLMNITSRLRSINGQIDVQSEKGAGTLNTLKIQL